MKIVIHIWKSTVPNMDYDASEKKCFEENPWDELSQFQGRPKNAETHSSRIIYVDNLATETITP